MTLTRRALLAILLLTCAPASLFAANGTLAPLAYQTVFDPTTGNPVSGAKICTYLAGTTTATPTWTEVTLTTQNTNPIIADTGGRFVAFLQTGASYKFAFQDATGTANTCDGAPIKTVDGIAAVPGSAANLDIVGTAGETLTAGQVVYLSDGSGSKTAGLWYKADSTTAYSNTTPEIGLVPTAIASGAAGTIRQAGQITGLTALVVGTRYAVGTAGALATTGARFVGQADTTASLVLSPNPSTTPIINSGLVCGRLTLTTATPVTTADVTAATTLFYTPISGCNQITLWTGAFTVTDTLTETSIAVPATTATLYDVFAFDNAGVVNIEVLAWTNDTTRATAITLQNGFLAKAATPARRYVGSFRTTAVSGQTEDSGFACTTSKRYVWNYYNRVRRPLCRYESTANWPYTTATVHQANGAAANQVEVVVGVAEVVVDVSLTAAMSNSAGAAVSVGIGEDSTTTYLAGATIAVGAAGQAPLGARLTKAPAIGRHVYSWNEWSTASGTTSWLGAVAAVGSTITNGLSGGIDG
jgi:hypothetical protein